MKNRVREVREAKGLRREDVASAAGVSAQTIYSMETGRTIPSVEIARRVAEALQSSLDELFPAA